MRKMIYFDNAATTALAIELENKILDYLSIFGNPSSTHAFGRKAKAALEQSRRKIAHLIGAQPNELIFTSGGTEANNLALHSAIFDLGVTHVISSPIEHPAVFKTLENWQKQGKISWEILPVDNKGQLNLELLEKVLSHTKEKTLLTWMHANNELGTLLPIEEVGNFCKKYQVYFHTDTVQTMGHFCYDLEKANIHFLTAAAHKFHGLKGAGFLYKKNDLALSPLIFGGSQEQNRRAGTENMLGILIMADALELAYGHQKNNPNGIWQLNQYAENQLKNNIEGLKINSPEKRLATILNVQFPPFAQESELLFLLDMEGIALSGRSACSSGAATPSPVLEACGIATERANLRISFSRYNTFEDVDYLLEKLKKIIPKEMIKNFFRVN